MVWIDYVIVAVVGVLAFLGILRGFVLGLLSLCGWIAGGWLVLVFGARGAELLGPYVSLPEARYLLASLALFVSAVLLTGLLARVLGAVVERQGLSGMNRALGMILGAARGVLLVTVVALLARLTPLPEHPWWSGSKLLPFFERPALRVRHSLPPELIGRFTLPEGPEGLEGPEELEEIEELQGLEDPEEPEEAI